MSEQATSSRCCSPVVRFGSEDEAVAPASDSEYGLSLSVLTGDAIAGSRSPSGSRRASRWITVRGQIPAYPF
jgi:acyl-CoA reductase-like NAD-dependent aldehyde dehydrogenase